MQRRRYREEVIETLVEHHETAKLLDDWEAGKVSDHELVKELRELVSAIDEAPIEIEEEGAA